MADFVPIALARDTLRGFLVMSGGGGRVVSESRFSLRAEDSEGCWVVVMLRSDLTVLLRCGYTDCTSRLPLGRADSFADPEYWAPLD